MLQITYISSARLPLEPAEIDDILRASRRNNDADGISGLLVHDGRRFLQALEGPEDRVRAAVARIREDKRHRAIVLLSERQVAAREFGDWAMAWNRVEPARDTDSLQDTVDALVADVPNANIRALFSGFARIERAA